MSEQQNPAIRQVTVKLNDNELRDRADALVAAMTEQETIEGEKKAAVSVYKERLDAVDGRIHKLKLSIENRAEERGIECLMEPDYKASKMLFLHPETRKVMGDRPLEAEEYQTNLGDVGKNRTPDVLAAGKPFQPGTCRYCLCDEKNGCVIDEEKNTICSWITDVDPPRTACSSPECVKEHAEAMEQAKKVVPIGAGSDAKKKRGRPAGKKNGKPGDGPAAG